MKGVYALSDCRERKNQTIHVQRTYVEIKSRYFMIKNMN